MENLHNSENLEQGKTEFLEIVNKVEATDVTVYKRLIYEVKVGGLD